MKKIFVLGSVLALAACGQQIDVAQHDADFAGCERVDTTKIHLVYKCPSNMDRFAEIKKQEPTALFQMGGGLNWDDVNADKENTYVEVVFGKYGKIGECAEDFHYRTMVKPFNTETKEMFAVVSCKTKAEKVEEKPVEEAAK
jgi:hypothetical protein